MHQCHVEQALIWMQTEIENLQGKLAGVEST